jgi:hypothetical protein
MMYHLVTDPVSAEPTTHGLKPPTLSQNKPFFFLSWSSQIFGYSNTKLTNTLRKQKISQTDEYSLKRGSLQQPGRKDPVSLICLEKKVLSYLILRRKTIWCNQATFCNFLFPCFLSSYLIRTNYSVTSCRVLLYSLDKLLSDSWGGANINQFNFQTEFVENLPFKHNWQPFAKEGGGRDSGLKVLQIMCYFPVWPGRYNLEGCTG